jgi:hypothetical protein
MKLSLVGPYVCKMLRLSHFLYTVDSRLSARGLTALRLNRGIVFLKKKIYFPVVSHLLKCFVSQSMLVYYNLERAVLAFTSSIDILPLFFLNFSVYVNKFQCINLQ